MTRTSNARIAGVTYLLYFAAGITALALAGRQHATDVLSVATSLSALVLGVTLYGITREVDADLALLGLTCRVVEAIPGHAGGIFFSVGSAIFCWLLLRGRMIPLALARLGVAASVGLAAVLLLQRAGFFAGAVSWFSAATWLVWLPMAIFEVAVAVWFIVKGVAAPQRQAA